ncbi:Os02g0308800 [Oryza sativa Japonica Group]|uniref:Os02g0308800 protein n=1 Tax=Oryza sativa subsp. japonica TaxID=39947 RepID=Q6Z0W0_ORYSJ|nr:unknown protein [Oryza sativa Japonica Group]BAH91647.1 Os02g0308800 [Oryza sativa Japonica Group]|eukprot:NP_001172918.1 Os02g0308800 [Oryza sativa Japonica Group]
MGGGVCRGRDRGGRREPALVLMSRHACDAGDAHIVNLHWVFARYMLRTSTLHFALLICCVQTTLHFVYQMYTL